MNTQVDKLWVSESKADIKTTNIKDLSTDVLLTSLTISTPNRSRYYFLIYHLKKLISPHFNLIQFESNNTIRKVNTSIWTLKPKFQKVQEKIRNTGNHIKQSNISWRPYFKINANHSTNTYIRTDRHTVKITLEPNQHINDCQSATYQSRVTINLHSVQSKSTMTVLNIETTRIAMNTILYTLVHRQ